MAASDRARVPGASFPIPDGFAPADNAAGGAAEAAPGMLVLRRTGVHDDIIPTVTLATGAAAPITDTVPAMLEGVLTDPGAFVVSCDVWPAGDVPARRILFTRPFDDDRDAVVDLFLWAAPDRTVRLAAQCAVHEHLTLQTVFAAMAQGIELTTEDA